MSDQKRFALLGPDASEDDDQAFADFLRDEDEDEAEDDSDDKEVGDA